MSRPMTGSRETEEARRDVEYPYDSTPIDVESCHIFRRSSPGDQYPPCDRCLAQTLPLTRTVPRSRPPSVRIGHSEVHLYTYGEDLYAAMLQAIRQAQERIVLETFIWKDDPIGQQFKQELSWAAERGVAVYIIFDSFANLVVPRRFKHFPAGLHVLEYPLFSWPWHPFHLRSYARDHRKILVVPDRVILRALLAAAQRGVDVRILLPATSNHVLADWLARAYYMQCLKAGIHLLLYQHAMVHAKTATIDSAWSTVGTANMDRLSMVGNFEVNVEIYDQVIACQMEDIFSKDASNTHELTLEEWHQRSLLEKLAETILLPLRPFL